MRICKITFALACSACFAWLLLSPSQNDAYAQAVQELREAESISWDKAMYLRATSKDGKRKWLHKSLSREFYLHPGLYRTEHLNGSGKVLSVVIQDRVNGIELSLNHRSKVAVTRTVPVEPLDEGPFAWVQDAMEDQPLEFVGPQQYAGGTANVFRRTRRRERPAELRFLDFWFDKETKQLVEYRNSIDRPLDPLSDPDRSNPPENSWKGTRYMGTIENNIVIDASLDESLFRMETPPGYSIDARQKQTVSESEMIEYLTMAVEFGGNLFPDSHQGMGMDSEKYNAIFDKPKSQWTEIEREVADTVKESMLRGREFPITDFIQDQTAEKSFRYLGKGVKLGQSDRIVCWYQLRETGGYRAVYGDLSVRDVDPDELPLPVR